MNSITKDFISDESRKFRFKIGRYLASSLAGFVVGVVAASIVWLAGAWYTSQLQHLPQNSSPLTQQAFSNSVAAK
jgi:hypothetical protein